ncbi:MAG: prepilin-type N-terminal cleavage/methylation domain-containing protein [Acidobacteriota bacterium]
MDLNDGKISRTRPRLVGQKGFTLIELLIAMVIFLIVTTAIYGVLQVGSVTRNRSSRRSDILKNARVAIQLIGRDALNAGYGFNRNGARVPDNFLATTFGLPADTDTNRDLLSSIIVGNDIFTNNLALSSSSRTDTVAFCYRDQDFNPTPPPLPAGTISTGQVVQLKDVTNPGGSPGTSELVSSTATGAVNAKQYDLYLVESDTVQAAVMATTVSGTDRIDGAPGDPLGLNQPLNGTGSGGSVLRKCVGTTDSNCTSYVATLTRFFLVSYKVKPDGTLVRTLYGNNTGATNTQQVQEQPLAYNVEDLQLRYVLDDGTVTDNPVAGDDGLLGTADDDERAVNRVRQIMVTIKVQSTVLDEQTNKAETITLNATFSTRNMEYDAG